MVRLIELQKVVKDTVSNAEGDNLFRYINEVIEKGECVHLSLQGATPLSTSFLNSSFGQLAEKYSVDIIRKCIKLTNYKMRQANRLKEYLEKI